MNAFRLTSSFPTEAIHRPTKELGLGDEPLKDRATQMGIDHIPKILKTTTERVHIAFAHVTRTATGFQHKLKEAHETNPAKIPTLRILS